MPAAAACDHHRQPHWQTELPPSAPPTVLETIHDFTGFPDALYAIRYPASGCREGAEVVAAARGGRPRGCGSTASAASTTAPGCRCA